MKTGIRFLLIGLLLLSGVASAQQVLTGKVYFNKAQLLIDKNSKITPASGSTGTLGAAHISNRTRYVDLPATGARMAASGLVPGSTGDPALAVTNATANILWEVGETGKVQWIFRVPADYVSGGTFKCMVSLPAASTDTTLDWEIYVNTTGVAFDAATTNQTPVAVANSTTLMQDISLATATDTFVAGDVVTLNVNRAAGTGTGANLSLYDCYLSYTADM